MKGRNLYITDERSLSRKQKVVDIAKVDETMGSEMQKEKKKRLSGGRGTDVARQRYALYRVANERLKAAYEAGFYIECVSICESIISDRMEARLQFLTRKTTKLSPVLSLGYTLAAIKKPGLETEADLIAVYEAVSVWAEDRNRVVHQFVKRTANDEVLSPEERIKDGMKTAQKGLVLMRKISALVRKYNKWETKT